MAGAKGWQYEIDRMDVPHLTAAQMREVDRLMIQEYGIKLLEMMENAGRNLAHVARDRFLGKCAGQVHCRRGRERWQWWRRAGSCSPARELGSSGQCALGPGARVL